MPPRETRRTRRIRDVALRIDAATPPDRDRAVDALRALAILGVVLGHWLVTAVVDTGGGRLGNASPLRDMPYLTPVSWLLQTLAVFFFVGGRVGTKNWERARARGTGYGAWLRGRLARLFRPVTALLGVWTAATAAMVLGGAEYGTVRALVRLVLSPLWFLLVLALLTAVTPLVARLHPLWPAAVVAAVDIARFQAGGPGWLGWVNVAAGWLVPYCLGARWGRGGCEGRRTGATLLAGGVLATAALVLWGGYPASMVGVNGARVSNLNPPTLAAVTFGLAQCGLALLLCGPLRRALARPGAWAAVALVNLSAMTVFLWHQTAMLLVTVVTLPLGPLPGLHTEPGGPGWVLARLAWLPVFALAWTVCWSAFHGFEHRRAPRTGGTAAAARTGGTPAGGRVVRESYAETGPASSAQVTTVTEGRVYR